MYSGDIEGDSFRLNKEKRVVGFGEKKNEESGDEDKFPVAFSHDKNTCLSRIVPPNTHIIPFHFTNRVQHCLLKVILLIYTLYTPYISPFSPIRTKYRINKSRFIVAIIFLGLF